MMEPIQDDQQAYQDVPTRWWVVKTRGHAFFGAGGATTVGPFWKPVHIRNLISLYLLKRAERKGY